MQLWHASIAGEVEAKARFLSGGVFDPSEHGIKAKVIKDADQGTFQAMVSQAINGKASIVSGSAGSRYGF